MAVNPDPTDRTTKVYDRDTTTRRSSGWGWALGALAVVLGLIALFAWDWDGEPTTTGAVAPPAAVEAPVAPAPVAPAPVAPAPVVPPAEAPVTRP